MLNTFIKAAVLSCFTYHSGINAAEHHLTCTHSIFTSARMMTPVAAKNDAMVQLEKYKGNTAKQGLPFHHAVWPGEAASQSDSEDGFASQKSHWKLLAWFYFMFVCLFFFPARQ